MRARNILEDIRGEAIDVIGAGDDVLVERQNSVQPALVNCKVLNATRVFKCPFHISSAARALETVPEPRIDRFLCEGKHRIYIEIALAQIDLISRYDLKPALALQPIDIDPGPPEPIDTFLEFIGGDERDDTVASVNAFLHVGDENGVLLFGALVQRANVAGGRLEPSLPSELCPY